MTMSREIKSSHQLELHIAKQNGGFTTEEFGKPNTRRAAIAKTGHAMMPAGEYKVEHMGRKVSTEGRRDVVIKKLQARRGR